MGKHSDITSEEPRRTLEVDWLAVDRLQAFVNSIPESGSTHALLEACLAGNVTLNKICNATGFSAYMALHEINILYIHLMEWETNGADGQFLARANCARRVRSLGELKTLILAHLDEDMAESIAELFEPTENDCDGNAANEKSASVLKIRNLLG